MEQSDTSKTHHHSIFIASLNHSIITHRSTRLRNILHATLMSTLNIITEWEECIRSQCNIRHLIQPCTFLFLCKYFRFLCESFLLALKPELLLLDEPFSALDSQTRLSVSDDIGRILHQEKKTAILVTHDISEAISMADRVIILSPRPAIIRKIVPICFDLENRTPMASRNAPEFKSYFNLIWKELNHDV